MALTVRQLRKILKELRYQDSYVWFSDAENLYPSCSVEAVRDDAMHGDNEYRSVTLLGPTRLRSQPYEKHVIKPKSPKKRKGRGKR